MLPCFHPPLLLAVEAEEKARQDEKQRAIDAREAQADAEQAKRLEDRGFVVAKQASSVSTGIVSYRIVSYRIVSYRIVSYCIPTDADAADPAQNEEKKKRSSKKGGGRPKGSVSQGSQRFGAVTKKQISNVIESLVFSRPISWERFTGKEEREANGSSLGGSSKQKMPLDDKVGTGRSMI